MGLLRSLGRAAHALWTYKCKEAIGLFHALPSQQVRGHVPRHRAPASALIVTRPAAQLDTVWALCQLARAHYELAQYPQAARLFEQAHKVCDCARAWRFRRAVQPAAPAHHAGRLTARHQLDPYRMNDMEIYSTVLWHMRDASALSYLAHELVSINQFAPQAWCALGNSFSLQNEHETAIKVFQRAVDLAPSFTYAHTLLGHECVYMEDFDAAIAHFRNALRIDGHHHNAWSGLGMIFYRHERFELAEYHLRRAISIHPHSLVLRCHLAMVYHRRGMLPQAKAAIDAALALDPNHVMCRFQLAVILAATGRATVRARAMPLARTAQHSRPRAAPR